VTAELIHGDALTVMAGMKAASVDLIATDPPFRVISGGSNENAKGNKNGRPRGILTKNDGKLFKHNDIEPSEYMPEMYRVLKPGRDAYIMTNNLTVSSLLLAADAAGFKRHGLLFWVKNTRTPSRWYMKDVELCVYVYKSPARAINDPRSKQTFECDNPRNKSHPTEKPVKLMQNWVGNSTQPGWTVLDPFMGSGSTGVASANVGCDFVGIELDKQYFDIAVERIAPQAANDNNEPLQVAA
jgi:site-specific DNA-methyltransferase (adenine-specific)